MSYNDLTKRRIVVYVPRKKDKMPKAKGLLLSKAVEGFTLACRARQLSEHTISDYSHTFKIFLAHIGDVSIETIQTAQVQAFLASRPVGAKTLLNYHVGLSALWTWAVKEEYCTVHTLHKIDRPKPKKTLIESFTELECRALFSGLRTEGDRDRAMLMVMLDTGLRASELCNMQVEDIDMINHKIKVLGKGNKERNLPFSPRTASALFKHLASLPKGALRPFKMDRTSLGHQITRIAIRAGVKQANPHKFRHTFAVNFLRNGGDPFTLQEILGHSNMETVKLYLRIAQIDIDSAHKRASPVENWKL